MPTQSLTEQDIEQAKRYIIWRSLSKALRKDFQVLGQGQLILSTFYTNVFESLLKMADAELHRLSLARIQIKKTDQPTVWEVRVRSRSGFIEVNVVEMVIELEKHIAFKADPYH